jgi:hypothetical protein
LNKFLTLIIIVVVIVVLFISMSNKENMRVVQLNNKDKKPLQIILGKYQDSDCGMIIDSLDYASQIVSPDNKTWFFHDIGGMVHWLENKTFKQNATIWVMSRDTKKWIDGKTAWYSTDENTPMLYGFGAYKNKKDNLVDFKTMQLLMLRGETMANPHIKKQILDKN